MGGLRVRKWTRFYIWYGQLRTPFTREKVSGPSDGIFLTRLWLIPGQRVPTYLLQSLQYLLLRSGDHWPVIVINIVRSCICGPSSEVISSFLILMAFVPKWRGERLYSFPVSEASTVITSLSQLFGKTWHGVNRVVGLQSDFNLKQLKRGINIAPVTIAEGHHTSWERIQPGPVNSKMR